MHDLNLIDGRRHWISCLLFLLLLMEAGRQSQIQSIGNRSETNIGACMKHMRTQGALAISLPHDWI